MHELINETVELVSFGGARVCWVYLLRKEGNKLGFVMGEGCEEFLLSLVSSSLLIFCNLYSLLLLESCFPREVLSICRRKNYSIRCWLSGHGWVVDSAMHAYFMDFEYYWTKLTFNYVIHRKCKGPLAERTVSHLQRNLEFNNSMLNCLTTSSWGYPWWCTMANWRRYGMNWWTMTRLLPVNAKVAKARNRRRSVRRSAFINSSQALTATPTWQWDQVCWPPNLYQW